MTLEASRNMVVAGGAELALDDIVRCTDRRSCSATQRIRMELGSVALYRFICPV